MKKRTLSLILAIMLVFVGMNVCIPAKQVEAASTLVWSDEFNGTSLDRNNWQYETGGGGWGNNELQNYTDRYENVSVSNGVLAITARKENYGGNTYTSGRIKSSGLKEFKYGRMEARILLPSGKGLWPAFWMLGANFSTAGWPYCGEIDIMERVNTENFVHGTVHWDSNGYATFGRASQTLDMNQYHVYAVEWDANNIRWYVDNVQYNDIYIGDNAGGTEEFQKSFFFILNLAVGGNWPGYPDGSTPDVATMYVDYVRVYQNTSSQSTYSGIQSTTNNMYICADNYGNDPLIANRSSMGDWESFQIINNQDGSVSLKSKANGLYVCADLNQNAKLIARSSSIDAWEKFWMIDYGNGQFALQSLANQKYVSADYNQNGVLYANRDAVGGSWEIFRRVN